MRIEYQILLESPPNRIVWIRPWVKTGICPSLEIETNNQNFLENLASAAQFRLIDLILAMAVYLPVWHSRCTKARFSVLVSCDDELVVHSCPLLCLQGQVAKLASGLFYSWSLLRSNKTATNLQYSLQVTILGVLSHVTAERRHLGR